MKKAISSVAALLMALLMLAGCSSQGGESSSAGSSAPGTGSSAPASSAEKTKVNVFAIKGPTGVGMVNLMKADEEGSVGNDYSFQIVSAPDEISGKLSSGEADIAALQSRFAGSMTLWFSYTLDQCNTNSVSLDVPAVTLGMDNLLVTADKAVDADSRTALEQSAAGQGVQHLVLHSADIFQ